MEDSCPEVQHDIADALPGTCGRVHGITHQLDRGTLQAMLMKSFLAHLRQNKETAELDVGSVSHHPWVQVLHWTSELLDLTNPSVQ